jgi:hypothetical protein
MYNRNQRCRDVYKIFEREWNETPCDLIARDYRHDVVFQNRLHTNQKLKKVILPRYELILKSKNGLFQSF